MIIRRKLKPRNLNLEEMCTVYNLLKKQLKFADGSLLVLVNLLYKSDVSNFNKIFEIVYGAENTNEELVACILLKFGLEYCSLLDFVSIISRQTKDD